MEREGKRGITNSLVYEDMKHFLENQTEYMQFCYTVAVWEHYQMTLAHDNNLGKDIIDEHEYNHKWWLEKGNEFTDDLLKVTIQIIKNEDDISETGLSGTDREKFPEIDPKDN